MLRISLIDKAKLFFKVPLYITNNYLWDFWFLHILLPVCIFRFSKSCQSVGSEIVFHYSCEYKHMYRHCTAVVDHLFSCGSFIIFLWIYSFFKYIFWIEMLCHCVLQISSSMCGLSFKYVHCIFSLFIPFFPRFLILES